jgi:hypothetical protein
MAMPDVFAPPPDPGKTLPDGAIASAVAIPEAAARPSVATSISMLRSWTSEARHNLDEVIELTLL